MHLQDKKELYSYKNRFSNQLTLTLLVILFLQMIFQTNSFVFLLKKSIEKPPAVLYTTLTQTSFFTIHIMLTTQLFLCRNHSHVRVNDTLQDIRTISNCATRFFFANLASSMSTNFDIHYIGDTTQIIQYNFLIITYILELRYFKLIRRFASFNLFV